MKFRLMGPPDLVAGWDKLFKESFPCSVRGPYKNRGGGNDERLYIDMDDREAEKVITSLSQAMLEHKSSD
ncbi:hypothetical protein R1W15_004266 [Vibrio fluvialis]|nr:hypothetical protein [Vibrio fluvialis]